MDGSTTRRRARACCAALAAIFLASAGPARADPQGERIDELERRLEQSLRLIEALTQKIDRLEGERGGAASGDKQNHAVARQGERIEALQEQVTQLGSGLSMRSPSDNGLPVHGFADVGFTSNNRGERKGFAVGSFDLYLTPQFSGGVKTLVEMLFEVDKDGELAVDAERLQIGYTFSDAATLWAGRFHTPIGYWNLAYHHGQQIQTSILRPRFLDFEDKGGIVPTHTVGLWLTGKRPLSGGRFDYDVFLGNGPRIKLDSGGAPGVLDPNAFRDDNHQATVGFNFAYEPAAVEGLKLGVHWLRGAVNDDAAAPHRTRLQLYGPYAAQVSDDWENIVEYYRFANRDESGGSGTHASWVGFLQIGRHFAERWTAYGRLERARLDQGDHYFAALANGGSYRRGVLGLRFDVEPRAALKFEINQTRFSDRGPADSSNEARAEYSVRF